MIRTFAADIAKKLGWRAGALFLLTGLTALFEGLAVAALLPLLQEVGLGGESAAAPDPVTALVRGFAAAAGHDVTIPLLAMAIVLIVSIQVSVFLLAQYLSGLLQARYMTVWLNRQFSDLIHARWKLFEAHGLSDAVTSLTGDLLHKTGNAFIHFMNLVAGAFFILVYTALAFLLDWRLTLAMIAGALALTLIMRPLSVFGARVGQGLVQTDQSLVSVIASYVSGIKVVKVFGLERAAQRDFEALSGERERGYFHYIFDPGLSRALIELFGPLFLIAALILGTRYLSQNPVTVLVALAIFARLYPRLATLQQAVHSLRILLPAFLAAKSLNTHANALSEPGTPTPKPGSSLPKTGPIAIELEGVSAGYGAAPVLKRVDLSIPAGSFVVVAGPSGSGKTTLIDTILGLLDPSEGRVLVNDIDLKDLHPAQWRASIGYVDQDSLLFHETIASNIRGSDETLGDDRVAEAARAACAEEFILELADGYDHVIGEAGKGLSGGQRQRIAIARALARKPGLLLLDEATSALDPETEDGVLEALDQLHGRTTVILATHRERARHSADAIVTISGGTLTVQPRR